MRPSPPPASRRCLPHLPRSSGREPSPMTTSRPAVTAALPPPPRAVGPRAAAPAGARCVQRAPAGLTARGSPPSTHDTPSQRRGDPTVSRAAAVQEEGPAEASVSARQFLRRHLLKLKAYTPIEPFEVLAKRLGRKPEDIIKLDANENPYGPPPEVLAALGAMRFPHIYPDPESRHLREALAQWHGVPAEHMLVRACHWLGRFAAAISMCMLGCVRVAACQLGTSARSLTTLQHCAQVGCGADELIDLLMRCVLDADDKIVDCPPTFTMYVFDAAVNNANVVTVPRLEGFKIDVEGARTHADVPMIKPTLRRHNMYCCVHGQRRRGHGTGQLRGLRR